MERGVRLSAPQRNWNNITSGEIMNFHKIHVIGLGRRQCHSINITSVFLSVSLDCFPVMAAC